MARHGHEEMPDPEKIREILDVVADKAPNLLRQLSDVLYGPDQAKKFGRAAAVFYKELKGTGMSDEEIFELTKQYMAALNVGKTFERFGHEHGEGERHGPKRKTKKAKRD